MHASLLALVTLAALAGCAKTPSQKTQADLATYREEQRAPLLLERGRTFATLGDPTRAEEYLVAALDAGAPPSDVMPLLLDVCVRGGRYRSAIQYAENHLRKWPRDVGTRLVLGTLYAAVGEHRSARLTLERVVSERPDEAQAHYTLGVLARDDDDDLQAADRHFREYLRIAPTGQHAEEARASLLTQVP